MCFRLTGYIFLHSICIWDPSKSVLYRSFRRVKAETLQEAYVRIYISGDKEKSFDNRV